MRALKPTDKRQPGRWSGLLLGQLLAIAFLAGCLWWALRELAYIIPADRVTASLSFEQSIGSVLAWRLAAFAAALVLFLRKSPVVTVDVQEASARAQAADGGEAATGAP